MISIENLSFSFQKEKPILKNISLDILHGEIHGVVGNNGEGKTTFFKCILGLIKNYEGSIIETDGISIRNNTGFLPTELYFYPRITGREYIDFQLIAKKQRKNKEKIDFWNTLFDLPLDQYAETYSTGMKKKLALMSIILQENKILLLDEPFNGVDLVSNLLLKEIMIRLKKNTTIILTSHILESLTTMCDKISYLKKGEIIKTYTPAEYFLIENEIGQQALENKISQLNSLLP